jgi:ABC-type nitrate/sulfonate/bicarbonate transport system permease component
VRRLAALSPIAIVAAWELAAAWARASGHAAASPSDAWSGLRSLAASGMPPGRLLPAHAAYSMGRVLLGFGAAAVVGVPLGMALGSSATTRALVRPVIEVLRPIPPLAWVPLSIAWFGIGVHAAAFIIFLGAVFPIVVSTCAGVGGVAPGYLDVARTLEARRYQVWLHVLVPAALPQIVTGMRVGLGVAWMTLVAAEFTDVRAGYGLGYVLTAARDLQRTDVVLAGMVVIGLIGWALDAGLRHAAARVSFSEATCRRP